MTPQEHRVSIIIPHYENYEILKECVKSLSEVKYRNIEIIVVDNNSSDQSIQKIEKDYPSLVIHSSKVNLGYAGGCNAGAKIAKGEFLLFLNNDTVHSSDFIDCLMRKIESNNKIACVQPKIKNYDKRDYFDYAGASGGFIDYLGFPFARGRIFNTIEKDKGQYNDSIVKDLLSKYERISKNIGVPMGYHIIEPDYSFILSKIKSGYEFLAFSFDTKFLGTICRNQMNMLNKELADLSEKND